MIYSTSKRRKGSEEKLKLSDKISTNTFGYLMDWSSNLINKSLRSSDLFLTAHRKMGGGYSLNEKSYIKHDQ